MIYLDNGATSFRKPPSVQRAVLRAMQTCANPGRGGYPAAMEAGQVVYNCREEAGKLFSCPPEQVAFTSNCTHGLNIAIRTLVKPGDRVIISGFEHNAVTRPLHLLKADIVVAGRKLFCWNNMLMEFERALKTGVKAAVFTHVSNVFGYILPVEEMAAMCRKYGVPFIMDAAQSAGTLPVNFGELGADFIAMPGHKGLLGPQGTGLLLCGRLPEPLMAGGTGSESRFQNMPDFLPDRVEAGTLNVPGIAGLAAGIHYVNQTGTRNIFRREHLALQYSAEMLPKLGARVFAGDHQAATLSFLMGRDCEETAAAFASCGVALRAGLHCAPLAHESAGTLESGTIRLSFGHDAELAQAQAFIQTANRVKQNFFKNCIAISG